MGINKQQGVQKKFSCRKVDFHGELLVQILQGMTLAPTVQGKLEAILQGISGTVAQSSSSSE